MAAMPPRRHRRKACCLPPRHCSKASCPRHHRRRPLRQVRPQPASRHPPAHSRRSLPWVRPCGAVRGDLSRFGFSLARGSGDTTISAGPLLLGSRLTGTFNDLNSFENVLVAGEDQQLMSGGGKVAQYGRGGLRPFGVEVHQHVVQHQRQGRAAPGVGTCQGQPQTQEKLLAGAAAEHLDRQRVPLGVVHPQHVFAQRRPHPAVTALRQPVEIAGRLLQRLRLPVLLIGGRGSHPESAGQRPTPANGGRRPQAASRPPPSPDASMANCRLSAASAAQSAR